MLRHKFFSRIIFNTIIILLTRRDAYLDIHYSTMLHHNLIIYSYKIGKGHKSKKRRSSVISYIPGHPSSNSNILVGTHLPPSPAPYTAAEMAVADQYLQPVVHMSESLKSKFWNANSVHSSLSSITDVNYNGDGVSSNSSAMRIPVPSESPPNTYFNAASCSTSFSISASHNSDSLNSDLISRTDTNSNFGGV